MAHKKGVGSTDNGRDSRAQYLGVKMYGGQFAQAGNILIRQRGTKFHAGENTYLGKDFTVHASVAGVVGYKRTRDNKRVVFVTPVSPKTPGFIEEQALPIEEAKVEVAAAPKKAKKEGDDLKKIEGIGPKIAELMNEAGITTFAQLAEASVEQLQSILDAAGPRFSTHNPATWARQAALAAAGKWDELKAWQAELDGGKE